MFKITSGIFIKEAMAPASAVKAVSNALKRHGNVFGTAGMHNIKGFEDIQKSLRLAGKLDKSGKPQYAQMIRGLVNKSSKPATFKPPAMTAVDMGEFVGARL